MKKPSQDGTKPADLKDRTKLYALDVIRFVADLPRDMASAHIGRQLLRSATSVGANYRSACRGRSEGELYSKLCIVEEECDETMYWLEILGDSGIVSKSSLAALYGEADQITRMIVAAKKRLGPRLKKPSVRESIAEYEVDLSSFDNESAVDLRPSTFDLESPDLDLRPSTFDLESPDLDLRPSTFDLQK